MLISENEMTNACQWLLENAGPSIRFRTLTELLHRDQNDIEVRRAYDEILGSKRLREITVRQNADGSFGNTRSFHGTDTTEDYLRELFELGVSPEHHVLKKGLKYTEKLSLAKTDMADWVVGLLTEPLGRAGKNQHVLEWYANYTEKFDEFLRLHRRDWLFEKRGYPATFYLEIPYVYVIRTLAHSWGWLRKEVRADLSKILEFLLVDMAEVSQLYLVTEKNPKVSYPNILYHVSSGTYRQKQPSALEFAMILECLWLLAEFGVLEAYPNVLDRFRLISGRTNGDGLWEFPIPGVTRAKALWVSYHGFALEEDWRKKESPLAELTFRICLIAEKNKNGTVR